MKTMKRTAMLMLALAALSYPAAAEEVYKIDPVHSFAQFKVGHLGISFVRGTFTDIKGTITADAADPGKSSVEVVIKTASVDTNKEERDNHLRSADFFDAEKYPEMSFKSGKVKKIDEDTVEIEGEFTLLGKTKTITVKVDKTGEGKDPWGGYRMGFEAEFTIMRSDYGMDKMIPAAGDKVYITLNVEGIRE